jgi:hypothetical protein
MIRLSSLFLKQVLLYQQQLSWINLPIDPKDSDLLKWDQMKKQKRQLQCLTGKILKEEFSKSTRLDQWNQGITGHLAAAAADSAAEETGVLLTGAADLTETAAEAAEAMIAADAIGKV